MRCEETLVEIGLPEGLALSRREECSALAVFGVRVVGRKAAVAAECIGLSRLPAPTTSKNVPPYPLLTQSGHDRIPGSIPGVLLEPTLEQSV